MIDFQTTVFCQYIKSEYIFFNYFYSRYEQIGTFFLPFYTLFSPSSDIERFGEDHPSA